MKPILTTILLGSLLSAVAQETKPAAPATPTPAKPEIKIPDKNLPAAREALEEAMKNLDKRNLDKLKDGGKLLEEGLKKNGEAAKLIERYKDKIPGGENGEAAKAAAKVKDAAAGLDEAALKKGAEGLDKMTRQIQEQVGKKPKDPAAAPAASKKPVPAVASTFDQMEPPAPLAGAEAAAPAPVPFITADKQIPMMFDLKGENSGDIRSRTYTGRGNCMIRQTTMAIDCDDLVAIMKEGFDSGGDQPKDNLTVKQSDEFDFERVTAKGRVRLIMLGGTKPIIAKAGHMVLDGKTGTIVLTDWPEIQYDDQCFVATSAKSVIRIRKMGNSGQPEMDENIKIIPAVRRPESRDLPRTMDKPVPAPMPKADN